MERSPRSTSPCRIDSLKIAEVIINARWRGVTTTVFVEQDYIRSKLKENPEPPEPDLASGETPAEGARRELRPGRQPNPRPQGRGKIEDARRRPGRVYSFRRLSDSSW